MDQNSCLVQHVYCISVVKVAVHIEPAEKVEGEDPYDLVRDKVEDFGGLVAVRIEVEAAT